MASPASRSEFHSLHSPRRLRAKPTPAGGGGGVALQQSAIQRPDDRSARFTVGQQVVLASALASTSVRPDDRADRFAISDGALSATSSNSGVSWDGAVTLGLGSLVLVLALGIGITYIRHRGRGL